MNYDSLWVIPSVDSFGDSTENIVEIMRAQGQHLKEATAGKVLAKFSRIKNIMANMTNILLAIPPAISLDEETKNLVDADDLYSTQEYGFEIYNQSYKFRILEMRLTPIYPVNIYVDEEIFEDIKGRITYRVEDSNGRPGLSIKSDKELLNCLRIIFTSKKVKYILYRLQQY